MQSVLVGGWACGVNCFVVNVSIFKEIFDMFGDRVCLC